MNVKYHMQRTVWNCVLQYRLHKNKKKRYYIAQARHQSGFFSNYFYTVGHMMLAERYGYEFAADWQSYPTPYREDHEISGTRNAWEYFFEQPCGRNIDDFLQKKQKYISEDKYPFTVVPYYAQASGREGYPTPKTVSNVYAFIQKYCPIKPQIKEEFDRFAEQNDLSHCLAVHMRGTDMRNTDGHARPLSTEQTLDRIATVLQERNLSRIFLCTDEVALMNAVLEKFGKDRVVVTDAYRSADGKSGIHLEARADDTMRENHRYLLGKEVLRDAYLLSCCDSIVCGKSNVAYAAIVFNNNAFQSITLTN